RSSKSAMRNGPPQCGGPSAATDPEKPLMPPAKIASSGLEIHLSRAKVFDEFRGGPRDVRTARDRPDTRARRAYCTQILADHGADVIKVEPPAGDETRDWGPPFHGEDAAYFVGINRNKRSIGVDLASGAGRAVLMKMLESADVLIENFKPGTLDKWGI